jgi:ubiquitin-like 1-activating enzyme E1 A
VVTKPLEFFSNFDITIATELDIDTLTTINASCRISNCRFYAAATHGLYGYAFADLISHNFVIERAKSNMPTPLPNTAESVTRTILSSTTKRENGKIVESVTKNEIYSPIILANTSPLPEEYTRIRRRRLQVTPLLTCLRALWEFQKISAGALPNSHHKADLELFTTLATEKHKELLLPHETLRSEFLRSFLQNLGSEISPAAAFIGGALAQDVINVLGAREQPLQNLLLFDGEECKAPIYAMHPIFPDAGDGLIGNGVAGTMQDGVLPGNGVQESNGIEMGGSVIV